MYQCTFKSIERREREMQAENEHKSRVRRKINNGSATNAQPYLNLSAAATGNSKCHLFKNWDVSGDELGESCASLMMNAFRVINKPAALKP